MESVYSYEGKLALLRESTKVKEIKDAFLRGVLLTPNRLKITLKQDKQEYSCFMVHEVLDLIVQDAGFPRILHVSDGDKYYVEGVKYEEFIIHLKNGEKDG